MTIKNGLYVIELAGLNSCLKVTGDSPARLSPFDSGNKNLKFKITLLKGSPNEYHITSPDGARGLSYGTGGAHDSYGKGYLKLKTGDAHTKWVIEELGNGGETEEDKEYSIRTSVSEGDMFIDSDHEQGTVFPWTQAQAKSQRWKIKSTNPSRTGTFEENFFTMSVKDAANPKPGEEYDYIIVGTGIGGGALLNDLYDTNWKLGKSKRILVLEKGGLVFHSHCLNTARPSGLANDRGQQNDSFFHKFKEDFNFDSSVDKIDWKGGAMYNLGGRSAAWGLFAPRVHDEVIQERFPDEMVKEMNEYYRKAERLMMISTPETKRIHQDIMDRLNIHGSKGDLKNSNVQWQWGRIASEFRDERNFDFAEGAYSTIDKMLEIAMSKPETGEHKDVKMVLNADVRSFTFADPDSKNKRAVNGIVVKDCDGDHHLIKVKTGGKVILCAGSVESPAILLRSPQIAYDTLRDHGGLRLTDHDIMFYTRAFRYTDPKLRDEYGAMKLQSYAHFDGTPHTRFLLNMSIDASSFLPKSASPEDSMCQLIFVCMTQSDLAGKSDIQLDPKADESKVKLASGGSEVGMICGEPKVKIVRGDEMAKGQEEGMKKLVAASMDALVEAAKIEFDGFDSGSPIDPSKIHLKTLQLGGVAHELGTLPIDTSSKNRKEGCVDDNLQFLSDRFEGLYVCDLSVLPWSPAANPTLTLAALAIRCSRHLLPRDSCVKKDGKVHEAKADEGKICVVNHSGAKIKVWLTHAHLKTQETGGTSPGEGTKATDSRIIEPGRSETWDQDVGQVHGLFVYQLDLATQHRKDELEQEEKDHAADEEALKSAGREAKASITRRMKKREERIATVRELAQLTGDEFVTTPVLVQVKPGINAIQHDARDGVTVVYRGTKKP